MRTRFLAFCVVLFPLVSYASADSQDRHDCSALIDKAFQVTGTQQEVADLPGFGLQFARNMGSNVDATSARIFKRALAPGPWLADLKKIFEQSCDSTMLQDVISAMDNPLGAKIREVERTEQNPATAQARAEFYRNMRLHPPADRRDQLAVRVGIATEAPEMSWGIVEATSKAVSKANGTPLSDADLAASRQKYRPILQSAVLLDVLFIYRNLSDDELEQYVRNLEMPPFRRFNHILNDAIASTFATRMTVALSSLRKNATASKSRQ